MASTLIQRIINPDGLTDKEKADIAAELGLKDFDAQGFKLSIHAWVAMIQEVIAQRKGAPDLDLELTKAEQVDFDVLKANIEQSTLDINALERIFYLGEQQMYSVADIILILGL